MRKLFTLIVLVAASFYLAWPAFSLYQIADGVKLKDESKLENKIVWGSVREHLREPVSERVKKEIENQSKGHGIEGMLAGKIAGEFTPKLVEKVLDAYVTPKGVIVLANQGGRINPDMLGINSLVTNFEQNNNANNNGGNDLLGGLLGKAKDIVGSIEGGKELIGSTLGKYSKDLEQNLDKEAASGSQTKGTSYGLDNIKSFAFNGPLSFEVGLAKSPDAKEPDLIAGMSFVDMDWKLSKIIPSL